MNKSIWTLVASLLLLITWMSCGSSKKMNDPAMGTTPSEAIADNTLAPKEKALLWKIEKDGLPSASYLYGTIHIIPKDDFFYPSGTIEAIEASTKMVFEIDMSVMTDMSAQMGLMQKSLMKDGKKISDLLSEVDLKIVKDHFDKMGLPFALFERMKPAFLTVFASEDMSPNSMQNGDMKSYEMEFMDIAKTRKMDMGGLETVDYQLSVFDSIPYTDQANILVESIKSSSEGEDELKKMIEIYKNQDLEGMGAMFSDESIGDMDILLNNRNRNWIPVMKNYMNEKPTFFAVGAGHLVGVQGVIALLRAEGYTLTPVINN